MSDEEKQRLKDYQKKYFQENKDLICIRQRERNLAKKKPKPEVQKVVATKVNPTSKPQATVKASAPKPKRYYKPKPYIIEVKEEEPFGFKHLGAYQKNLMKELAPEGWYERPKDENPFVLEFT